MTEQNIDNLHLLYLEAHALLERCAKDDVPTDVFLAVSELSLKLLAHEKEQEQIKPWFLRNPFKK